MVGFAWDVNLCSKEEKIDGERKIIHDTLISIMRSPMSKETRHSPKAKKSSGILKEGSY